jgi:D-alanyl-D-alanine dipeptidase
MSSAKPYRSVPIKECGEPLVPIPKNIFTFFEPHPYVVLGAPYGRATPWMLRQSILASLQKAQINLQKKCPGWRIKLFDAYRPNAVQSFMVERELTILAKQAGLDPETLTHDNREKLLEKVYRIFAVPSSNPLTPPPHSTGAVFDCTLCDENGQDINMGSELDENSDRSYPDYFINAQDKEGKEAHKNRILLRDVLLEQGFQRNPTEWWHFSRGDQLAQWIEHGLSPQALAIYGAVADFS